MLKIVTEQRLIGVFYVSNSHIGFDSRVTYTISRVQMYGILFQQQQQ
jgi:cytosine/uracil/thiamine/allantoin permease